MKNRSIQSPEYSGCTVYVPAGGDKMVFRAYFLFQSHADDYAATCDGEVRPVKTSDLGKVFDDADTSLEEVIRDIRDGNDS
ncbi:MAG: hypothetical protein QF381_02940 [Nitrososphaerales archaeon]|jgi:hypothetical protein|nr:hypothetical protein [Nitrososphaerales archaeon]